MFDGYCHGYNIELEEGKKKGVREKRDEERKGGREGKLEERGEGREV